LGPLNYFRFLNEYLSYDFLGTDSWLIRSYFSFYPCGGGFGIARRAA
jgi:hypothetical protein